MLIFQTFDQDKQEKLNKQHPNDDIDDDSGAAVVVFSTEQSTVDSKVSLLQIRAYCLECALHGRYLTATIMVYLMPPHCRSIIIVEANR